MKNLFVIAQVGDQQIAFDAATVESVIDIGALVRAPLAPTHVSGICAVRSQVLTVIDVATVVGEAPHDSTRAVVVTLEGHSYALRVTAVVDVAAQAGPPEQVDLNIGEGWHAVAMSRIETACGFALLVDPHKLLLTPRLLAA